MYHVPVYIWALELAALVGLIAAVCVALYRGATASGLAPGARRALTAGTAAVLTGWLAVSAYLGGHGVYRRDPGETVPWIGVAITGVLVVALLAARTPAVGGALADRGTPVRLVAAQSFRVVGAVFLILLATGDLPAVFALPAGLGDVAVGVAAPFVARRLARDPGWSGAVAFNWLGLLDLVVAVGVGFLAAPGPLQVIDVSPSTVPLTVLPLTLIPTVGVPLAAALHLLTLNRLPRRVALPRPDLSATG